MYVQICASFLASHDNLAAGAVSIAQCELSVGSLLRFAWLALLLVVLLAENVVQHGPATLLGGSIRVISGVSVAVVVSIVVIGCIRVSVIISVISVVIPVSWFVATEVCISVIVGIIVATSIIVAVVVVVSVSVIGVAAT